jgi:hypothetical protein
MHRSFVYAIKTQIVCQTIIFSLHMFSGHEAKCAGRKQVRKQVPIGSEIMTYLSHQASLEKSWRSQKYHQCRIATICVADMAGHDRIHFKPKKD